MTFKEEMVTWRNRRGITQVEAARILGTSERNIENWEQGRYRPPEYARKSLLEKMRENTLVTDNKISATS